MSSLKRGGMNHIKPLKNVSSPTMTVTEFSPNKIKQKTVKFSDEMNFGQKAQEVV